MKRDRVRLLNEFVLGTLMEIQSPDTTLRVDDSVDDQIDSILLRYESDCIVSVGPGSMGEARLHEAPGDDEEEDDPADAPKQPELGSPDDADVAQVASQSADKDDVQPDAEANPLQPKIDIKMFAGKVSRLCTNYPALLDISVAIGNRARNYIEQNYSKPLADEFVEIMLHDFDIELTPKDTSEPREKPIAVGGAATGLAGG